MVKVLAPAWRSSMSRDNSSAGQVPCIVESIHAIQGKDYADFVMIMFNTYSISMATLLHIVAKEDRSGFHKHYGPLKFLIATMAIVASDNVARHRIALHDKRSIDPETIRQDIMRDFIALAKRMELHYEAI